MKRKDSLNDQQDTTKTNQDLAYKRKLAQKRMVQVEQYKGSTSNGC